MTFHIAAGENGKTRLEADAQLRPSDFSAIAGQLHLEPLRARKIGYVAARQARRRETVETHWNGTETTNTAQVGDWIVTSLSPQQQVLRDAQGSVNTYVIAADRFPGLYE